jgi:hypothetical protein
VGKSKLIIIACLFLVHAQIAAAIDIGTIPLTPPKKVSPLETSPEHLTFLKTYNILTISLAMYYLDTKGRFSKEAIRDNFEQNLALWAGRYGIEFDLDNIDFQKKGFTRYYPFTVNGHDFIIRFFDVKERHFLPPVPEVYAEGVFESSEIGFQIIPGINAILAGTRIERIPFPDPTVCSKNP